MVNLGERRARRLDIVFSVHRDAIEARVAGEGEHRFGHDFAAIAAFALQTDALTRRRRSRHFGVDGDVPLRGARPKDMTPSVAKTAC